MTTGVGYAALFRVMPSYSSYIPSLLWCTEKIYEPSTNPERSLTYRLLLSNTHSRNSAYQIHLPMFRHSGPTTDAATNNRNPPRTFSRRQHNNEMTQPLRKFRPIPYWLAFKPENGPLTRLRSCEVLEKWLPRHFQTISYRRQAQLVPKLKFLLFRPVLWFYAAAEGA